MRGNHERLRKLLPLTLTLSPRKSGEREPGFPAEARAVLREGVARLTDYQNEAYASRYLARVRRIAGHPRADGELVRELARHLAVRMSVEDVIRVAQLKLRDSRLARVTREAQARQGDIVDITEYMKPGPEEVLGLLPPRLGRWALARVRHDRSWPLKVRTTRFSGFLRLKLLAGLKFWRPRTLRFAEEEAWIERWLALVEQTLPSIRQQPAKWSPRQRWCAAMPTPTSVGSPTGRASWRRWWSQAFRAYCPARSSPTLFCRPRLAAVKDPEGEALANTIAAITHAVAPKKLAAE